MYTPPQNPLKTIFKTFEKNVYFYFFCRPSAGFFFERELFLTNLKNTNQVTINPCEHGWKWLSYFRWSQPSFEDVVLIQFHIRIVEIIVEINLITVIKSHNVFGISVGRLQVFPPLLLRRIVFLPRFPFVLRITFLEHSALVVSTGRSNLPVWAWKTENFYK